MEAAPWGPEDLLRLDAEYQGFPPFNQWPTVDDFDAGLWDHFVDKLQAARREGPPEDFAVASEIVIRAAAFDTGALEGLYSTDRGTTISVATEAPGWQRVVEAKDPTALPLFEAQLRTYQDVLAATQRGQPVTEAWIRALHAELCEPQETYRVETAHGPQEHPLPKGSYKTAPNHVRLPNGGLHPYAPVNATASEMQRLVEEMRSEPFAHAHPVLQASYSHFALAAIHPFADGNGRVARALASAWFYWSIGVPLAVFAQQRDEYLDALEAADGGDLEPFVRFVLERGSDAVGLMLEWVRTRRAPDPETIARDLARLLAGQGGVDLAELDETGVRLRELVGSEVERQVGQLHLPRTVTVQRTLSSGVPPAPPYHLANQEEGSAYLNYSFHVSTVSANTQLAFRVLVANRSDQLFTFFVENGQDTLEVRLEEVWPEETPSFRLRLESWVRSILGETLQSLSAEVAASRTTTERKAGSPTTRRDDGGGHAGLS